MLEYHSPKKIYLTLVSGGVVLGMALAQLLFVMAGEVEYSNTAITISALASALLLPLGWRMVASLPWGTINDPARYEYRNPHGPSAAVGDGGEKESGSIPSGNPAAQGDPER